MVIDLGRVFMHRYFAGEPRRTNLIELHRRMANGEIVADAVTMPDADPLISRELFTGSWEHRVLCARAATWLAAQGYEWCGARWYMGGRSDVSAVKERLHVECGGTQATKVMRACSYGDRVLVFPYSTDEDVSEAAAFLFSRGKPFVYGDTPSADHSPPGELLADLAGHGRKP